MNSLFKAARNSPAAARFEHRFGMPALFGLWPVALAEVPHARIHVARIVAVFQIPISAAKIKENRGSTAAPELAADFVGELCCRKAGTRTELVRLRDARGMRGRLYPIEQAHKEIAFSEWKRH